MNKWSRDSNEMEAFHRYDERLLEDLAVYCGLALQYVQAVQITEERRASIEVTQEVGELPFAFVIKLRSSVESDESIQTFTKLLNVVGV